MTKVTFFLSANGSCHWNATFLLPHLNTFHLLFCKSLSHLTLLKCFASQSHLKITANHNLCHSLKLIWQQIFNIYLHRSTKHIFKLSHLSTLTHKTFDTLASETPKRNSKTCTELHFFSRPGVQTSTRTSESLKGGNIEKEIKNLIWPSSCTDGLVVHSSVVDIGLTLMLMLEEFDIQNCLVDSQKMF